MKRSEFLEKLYARLHEKWGYDLTLSMLDLSTILAVCERLGMKYLDESGWEKDES